MFCLHPVSSALPDETRNWPDTRSRQLEIGSKAQPWFCFFKFLLFFCLVESRYFDMEWNTSPRVWYSLKNDQKHKDELCNYNSLERQPPYLYFVLLSLLLLLLLWFMIISFSFTSQQINFRLLDIIATLKLFCFHLVCLTIYFSFNLNLRKCVFFSLKNKKA